MQIKSLIITLIVGSLFLGSCNTFKSSKVQLKTLADSAAYAIGIDIGNNIKKNLPTAPGGKDLDQKIILAAFTSALNGDSSQIPAAKVTACTQSYFMKAQQLESGKAGEAGKKFLAENLKRTGVKATASGLQYEIMKEGTGPKPLATDTVLVHYHGTTIEGKVFDSSVDRKQPAKFPVNQVIPGWTEALQLMSVGSKWKLVIPAELAYGERGAGADIKPNSVLVFEVELLEIKK
ncbi:MAG: FKBP-type peptidyl-prolyl cis-trans isomerase [Mariniphaga sp.]